ncbi:MAG: hypothetical protein GOVbin140_41 [Prokaryotic dsDNA virus sp.]|nr:MAG: hypothetical protein GOVbin140_41 [Prokaryotic dsDNA virus sp.]|tara:strand:- start:1305 stop:1469 length:165 start_codon:yes stop_codon:yes gene_type:complete
MSNRNYKNYAVNCRMCGDLISKENTKSHEYHGKTVCGRCYLKKQRQLRKEKGLL